MTDFYKNIKLINNSIIIGCIALILINLPADIEPNKYEEAVKELAIVPKVRKEIEEYERDLTRNQYGDKLNFISKILDDLPFEPIQRWTGKERPKRILNDINNGIDRIIFWSPYNIVKYEFDSDFESNFDVKKLRKWYLENNKTGKANGWGFTSAMDSVNIVLLENNIPWETRTFHRIKYVKYSYSRKERLKYLEEQLDNNNLLIKDDSSINKAADLKTLPNLKNSLIWGDVKNQTMEDANSFLEAKAEEKRKSQAKPLTIFGFSIPSIYASFVGPIAIIALLFFMKIHLKQLKKELDKSFENKTYPWIGIYSETQSRIVFTCLIVVLPLIACFLALYSSNYNLGLKLLSGSIYIGLIVIIGISMWNTTSSIISTIENDNKK